MTVLLPHAEPDTLWLIEYAGGRVQVGEDVDFGLRIYRTDDGVQLADTQVAVGEMFGNWMVDSDQFFAWNHVPH